VQHRQIARVEDVAPHGHAVDRSTVRQKETGQPVKFEMTEQTREAIDNYIAAAKRQSGEFLFGGRRGRDRPITTRQYARLVGQWIAGIGLDRRFFGTHSLRRTKATLIHRRIGSLRAVQLLLRHKKIESTVRSPRAGRAADLDGCASRTAHLEIPHAPSEHCENAW
jgi:integrase